MADIGHNNPPFDFFALFDLIIGSSATTTEKLIAIIRARHIGKSGVAYPSRDRQMTMASCSQRTYTRAKPVADSFFHVDERRGRPAKYTPNTLISEGDVENAIAAIRKQERAKTATSEAAKMAPSEKRKGQNGAKEEAKLASEKGPKWPPSKEKDLVNDLRNDADENARALSDLSYYRERLENAANGALVNIAGASGLLVMSEPIAWIEQGCDLHKDILPAVQAVAHRSKPNSISSWRYFSKPVADAKARRETPMPEGRAPLGGVHQSFTDREVERHRKLMALLGD